SDDAGMNPAMKTSATKPSENAIGMPENITTSVTAPNKSPSASTLICGRRSRFFPPSSREMRGQLQNELHHQQRHPECHQAVRNRQRRRERRRRCHVVDPGLVEERPRLPREECAERERQEIDDDDPYAVDRAWE